MHLGWVVLSPIADEMMVMDDTDTDAQEQLERFRWVHAACHAIAMPYAMLCCHDAHRCIDAVLQLQ